MSYDARRDINRVLKILTATMSDVPEIHGSIVQVGVQLTNIDNLAISNVELLEIAVFDDG